MEKLKENFLGVSEELIKQMMEIQGGNDVDFDDDCYLAQCFIGSEYCAPGGNQEKCYFFV